MSPKPLEDVLKMYDQVEYICLDQDVSTASFADEDERSFEDVFTKTNVCWENNESIFSKTIKTNFQKFKNCKKCQCPQ